MAQKAKSAPPLRRRWSDEENIALLDHLLEMVRKGKAIEKPNASAYYNSAAVALKIEDCNGNQLKNQVKNLRTKYTKAIAWRDQTGQGVLVEEGEESVKRALLKRCPQFDQLDEIFGTRISITPPHIHDSSNESQPDSIK